MKADRLLVDDTKAFVSFCQKHRHEIDDSFLYDKDLDRFVPDADNPTYVIRDSGKIVAAASLILDDYHRRGKNGRFRIFHAKTNSFDAYALLFSEILKHRDGIDKVFLFVPFANRDLAAHMEQLHFYIERYSFLLIKNIHTPSAFSLPGGFSFRAFQPGRDEVAWCDIRNTAFAHLKGNSTPVTPEMVRKIVAATDYLKGGLILLLHEDKPVGIVRCAHDDYEGTPAMNIGPLALLPPYQGKGLGKQLLRAALHFAKEMDYKKTILCVDGENERAKELYLKEGFVQTEGVAAYAYYFD